MDCETFFALVHHRLRCPGADEVTVRRALDGVAAALRTGDGTEPTGSGRRAGGGGS